MCVDRKFKYFKTHIDGRKFLTAGFIVAYVTHHLTRQYCTFGIKSQGIESNRRINVWKLAVKKKRKKKMNNNC